MKVILFESNMEGMEWNHFMIILLLDPYFKIKGEYIGVFWEFQ